MIVPATRVASVMRVLVPCLLLLFAVTPSAQSSASVAWLASYRETAATLIASATGDDFAWQRLAELTDTFGPRLSGSENLSRAITWAADAMKRDGLDRVRTEPVMVPHWIRGHEAAEITAPQRDTLTVLGLGDSVSTPAAGIEGDVLVVTSFDDLRRHAADARGRIVLFNVSFINYGETVAYRTGGARAAAVQGAIGALVRAVGPMGLRTPHTGAVQYAQDVAPIPSAAIAGEDANRIARMTARGQRVRVRLTLGGHFEADAASANVVGEILGRERPEEIVLLGGHLDSWDVGSGASDDAVGCVVTWEALRLMKKLGLRPRRTVRLVLFTNEENGLRGAAAYADHYAAQARNHVFALESDSGVFLPAGLGFSGSEEAHAVIRDIATLLAPLGLLEVRVGGGGADVGPIALAGNAPMMAYLGDSEKYFQIHHTPADTIERIAPAEVSRAAAVIAVMAYVVADMPQRLPK